MLSQLNLDSDRLPNDPNDLNLNKFDFGQKHPIACFSRKIIPLETQYKTHDVEL